MKIELKSDVSLKPFSEVFDKNIFIARIYVGGKNPLKLNFYLTDKKEVEDLRNAISNHNDFLKFSLPSAKFIIHITNGKDEYEIYLDDIYSCYFGRFVIKDVIGFEV